MRKTSITFETRSKAGRPEKKTQKSQENQREYRKALNITMHAAEICWKNKEATEHLP
jgi:hypothetical protein